MLAPLLVVALLLAGAPQAQAPPVDDAPRLPPAAVTQLAPAPPPVSGRAQRITIELLVAAAAGVGVGAFGGYVGCLASPSNNGQSCSLGAVAAVGLSTYGLTIGAVVPLTGNALGGDGVAWAAWLGEAIGLGGGLALAQGNPKNAMLFAAPLMLVGAITGYELTASERPAHPSTPLVQAVAIQPVNEGAVLAVAGRF